MIIRKKPEASLKLRYRIVIRLGLIFSLLLLITLFATIPKPGKSKTIQREVKIFVETTEIPETVQKLETAPPPSRPSIPIESEDEDLSEDVTIEETTDLNEYTAWDTPPPPPSEEEGGRRYVFIPYDEPPEPIGGYTAIQRNVVYPEIAREAGIEGTVVVRAFINEFGVVTDCFVAQGIPNTGLDEAAIEAVKRTRFKPAKQRDRNVGVWISIPIVFKLKN
ncbi:MAG: energy transducer TonB [Candidatus Marinimicrobia bacterium]|nr:energy transducer TonB [Candidatus Neomarinimicrobiota bacterium]